MNRDGITGHGRQIQVLERLIARRTVPHTLLFHGIPGTGKKLVARRFLASLFCAADDPPCGRCPSCMQAAAGTHPDLIEIAPDARGLLPIGDHDRPEIGTVRWLIERLSRKSVSGRCGVLIDGADAIRTEGQNALLKTVEEPQEGAHIILIASSRSPILPTIRSRCTELSFNPLEAAEVRAVLEAAGADGDPDLAAELSGGSAETGLLLCEPIVMRGIAGLCGEITAFLERGATPGLDITELQKTMGAERLLAVLTGIYHRLLSSALTGSPLHPALAAFGAVGWEKLSVMVKILLALRKGLSNNLNIRNALKGMLYDSDRIHGFGLPDLGRAETG